jgi:preprotein translocase subunit SecA
VHDLHAQGRAVLVGLRSVESSNQLAALLRSGGLEITVLNAIHHAEEAEIVARAGEPGRITIATNMAGRGTDIRLAQRLIASGGLHVIIAEVNDSARIDRQLAGRCGRQGDPGSVSAYLSLQDALAVRYLPRWVRAALSVFDTAPAQLTSKLARPAFRWAQRRAEADAFHRRLSVLRHDEWTASALPFLPSQGA